MKSKTYINPNLTPISLFKLTIGVLLLLTSMLAHAAAGWSGYAQITSIYAVSDKRIVLQLSNFANPGNCQTNANGHVIINAETHPNWFSMAMAAYIADKTVNIWVIDSCYSVWADSSYAEVGHFRLKQP